MLNNKNKHRNTYTHTHTEEPVITCEKSPPEKIYVCRQGNNETLGSNNLEMNLQSILLSLTLWCGNLILVNTPFVDFLVSHGA